MWPSDSPPRLARRPWLLQLVHAFEWLLVPMIAIGLSAVPALDAQTRLMLGRYMEFWVTEKERGSGWPDAAGWTAGAHQL